MESIVRNEADLRHVDGGHNKCVSDLLEGSGPAGQSPAWKRRVLSSQWRNSDALNDSERGRENSMLEDRRKPGPPDSEWSHVWLNVALAALTEPPTITT